MTKKPFTTQDAMAEIIAVREARERNERQRTRIADDDCLIAGQLVGRVSELPLWAQAYIRSLREEINR